MSRQDATYPSTVLQTVNSNFRLPFQPREMQAEAIENLAPLPRTGWYADPGCGKTLMSTVSALYKRIEKSDLLTFVLMPPILLKGWLRWLEKVEGIGNVLMYYGTKKQRAKLDVANADWILTSMQTFKNDINYLLEKSGDRPRLGIVDEATSIKNPGSDNHRAVAQFFDGHDLMLLTGTPLSNPGDAYAYIKLISPGIYRSQRQFLNVHAKEEDFFGNITKWDRLDLLHENLMLNSMRMLKEEALKDLKEPVYVLLEYDLDAAHMRLYRQLVDEQILILENGGKIDATGESRLYNASQQIICNWDYFSGDSEKRSAVFDVIDNTLEELGILPLSHEHWSAGRKLIIFAQYKMTNRAVTKYLQPYGAVACFSDITPAQQMKNFDAFVGDPKTQVLVAHPLSAGYGLNPQEVCSDVLFLEEPIVPKDFIQARDRVYRDGQKNTPVIRIAIAENTIQRRLHQRLLGKDELVNQVARSYRDLREAIHGS